MGVYQHQPGVVVILDAQVIAGAEPSMMHGVEAVVPTILGGKGERRSPGIQVCLQQFQLQAAGGPWRGT